MCPCVTAVGVPETLLHVLPSIQNGTLLCDLAGLVAGKRVAGVIQRPKSVAVARRNIDKALG